MILKRILAWREFFKISNQHTFILYDFNKAKKNTIILRLHYDIAPTIMSNYLE